MLTGCLPARPDRRVRWRSRSCRTGCSRKTRRPQPSTCRRWRWSGERRRCSTTRRTRARRSTSPTPPRAPSATRTGQVHLIASHYVTRAMVGPSLDTVRHDCAARDGLGPRRRPGPLRRSRMARVAVHHGRPHGPRARPQRVPGLQPSRACSIGGLPELLVQLDHAGPVDRRRAAPSRTPRRRATWSRRCRTATSPTPAPSACSSPATSCTRPETASTTRWSSAQAYRRQRSGTCVMRTARLDRPAPGGRGTAAGTTSGSPIPTGRGRRGGPRLRAGVDRRDRRDVDSLTYNTYFDKYVLVSPAGAAAAAARRVCGLLLLDSPTT